MNLKCLFLSLGLLVGCDTNISGATSGQQNEHHGVVISDKDQLTEICFTLDKGQKVNFEVKFDKPSAFNFHYHLEEAFYPIPEKIVDELSYEYTAELDSNYCLMWENESDRTQAEYKYKIH